MLLKTKLLLVGGSALALLFLGKSASASGGGGGGGGGGGPLPGPLPKPPLPKPPNPLPAPQGQQARVNVTTGQGGMVVRTEPSTQGGNATLTGTSIANGTLVTVLETGIPDADGTTGGEWMRLVAPNGVVGYSRSVDPQGNANFVLL